MHFTLDTMFQISCIYNVPWRLPRTDSLRVRLVAMESMHKSSHCRENRAWIVCRVVTSKQRYVTKSASWSRSCTCLPQQTWHVHGRPLWC